MIYDGFELLIKKNNNNSNNNTFSMNVCQCVKYTGRKEVTRVRFSQLINNMNRHQHILKWTEHKMKVI